ncbi:peptidoglycan monomer (N-acetylglucosamine-1,6-anhydro-N-acetylmuramic acid-tetrapeptide) uptake protein (major facilitator superfamily protein) [Escherichia coli]|nr:peptidoglycan monomer (N-acetylglucosamine-1,6-anhydro-N-acetylmuramic acid-tetrapeptide) uptake protein (major facilitator superfamily protein) [Escherichia coli]
MTVENIDLKTIGFFSLVGQAYVFKFLWSPLMDRYTPPFFGRRRGWLLATQILLLVAIAAMGFLEPGTPTPLDGGTGGGDRFLLGLPRILSSMRGKPMCSRQKNVVRARQSACWVTV